MLTSKVSLDENAFHFLDGEAGSEDQKEAMDQEKKQREHLLALNQVIARQVMEKSRMVAGTCYCYDHPDGDALFPLTFVFLNGATLSSSLKNVT